MSQQPNERTPEFLRTLAATNRRYAQAARETAAKCGAEGDDDRFIRCEAKASQLDRIADQQEAEAKK